jgi:RHS repeat-associated protein
MQLINPLSQTTLRSYNGDFGLMSSETDPNGITYGTEYDQFGRVYKSTAADGTYVTTTYTECAALGCESGIPGAPNTNFAIATEARFTASGAAVSDKLIYLDTFERAIATKERLVTGGYSRVGRKFDALGRVSAEMAPCPVAACAVFETTFAYDQLSRVLSETRPVMATTPGTQQTTLYTYAGRIRTRQDAEGKLTTSEVDVNGMLRRTTDADGYFQKFSYDSLGNVRSVVDAFSNPIYSAGYTYGLSVQRITVSNIDSGTWSYKYNSLGDLVEWTDAKGQITVQTYDGLSRVMTRTEAEGVTNWTWGISAANHNIGRLEAFQGPGGTLNREEFTYDSVGRPVRRRILTDSVYDYDLTYDATGQMSVLSYPQSPWGSRLRVQHVYQYGQLERIVDADSAAVYWQVNQVDARGNPAQETLGNGVVTQRYIDAVTGLVGSIQSGVGGGAQLQNETFSWNRVGSLTMRQENNLGLSESFLYDNLHRLDHSTLQSGSGTVTNLQMHYDAMGNITSRSDVAAGAPWTYHASKKHAVIQAGDAGHAFSYDANGNAISRYGNSIDWTSYNYPAVINGAGKTLTFSYDANRRRYKQIYSSSSGVETTIYAGDLLEKVTSGSVADWRHYIKVGSRTVALVSRTSGGSVTRYVLGSHLGSVANIVDSSGQSYVKESFAAFGTRRDAGTWEDSCLCDDLSKIKSVSRRGFTEHEHVGGVSMGLVHMNGRVQDSITGRFLSPDPLVADPSSSQGYNRYTYAGNNPLTFVDPSGFNDSRTFYTDPSGGLTITIDGKRGGGGGSGAGGSGSGNTGEGSKRSEKKSGSETGSQEQDKPDAADDPALPCPNPPSPGPGRATLNRNIQEARRNRPKWFALSPLRVVPVNGGLYNLVGQGFRVVTDQNYKADPKFGDPGARFGNFNFGSTFQARGFSLQETLTLSNQFQFFTTLRLDPPEDIADVGNGWAYAALECEKKE